MTELSDILNKETQEITELLKVPNEIYFTPTRLNYGEGIFRKGK